MSLEINQLTIQESKPKLSTITTPSTSTNNQEIVHDTINNNDNTTTNESTSIENLDFIATSNSIKTIFSIPYHKNSKVTSIAIHNIGNGTLVLDEANYINDTDTNTTTTNTTNTCDNSNTINKDNNNDSLLFIKNDQETKLLLNEKENEEDVLVNVFNSKKNVIHLLKQEEEQNNNKSYDNILTAPINKSYPLMIEAGDNDGDDDNNKHEKEIINNNETTSSSRMMDNSNSSNGQLQLQPPEYYANNVGISTPSTPRQYIPWKFHDMSLVVASDALLYRNDTTTTTPTPNTTTPSSENALVVRVADANSMKHHTMMYQRHYCNPSSSPWSTIDNPTCLPSYADVLTTTSKTKLISSNRRNETMELQTCVIPPTTPTTSFINDFYNRNYTNNNTSTSTTNTECNLSSTICTCLDAYLDTIMTNVPQLALCLEEKGYIQSVKLLQSNDIPTKYFSSFLPDSKEEKPFIFQPNVVDLNATILLRFLKENCTTENSTYLLHHTPGSQQVQLYDVTSISQNRQRKWIWWLATISYRFALRLIRMSSSSSSNTTNENNNSYGNNNTSYYEGNMESSKHLRDRTRNLLRTTLDLLMELSDMDEDVTIDDDTNTSNIGRYETIKATVYELLADTFLQSNTSNNNILPNNTTSSKSTWLCKSSIHPYENLTVDGLTKGQDYLLQAIKTLKPFLIEKLSEQQNNDIIQSIQLQLFGLHHKVVNVSLRLASHHLRNYWSSSVMQSLRISANTLSDSFIYHPIVLSSSNNIPKEEMKHDKYIIGLLYQYAWIWEYCGHFARSFAATGDLWRERGHACGDDVISLLQEVEDVFFSTLTTPQQQQHQKTLKNILKDYFDISSILPITNKTNGKLTLQTLEPLVNNDLELIGEDGPILMEAAESMLNNQKSRVKDKWRVLVSSALCYSRAIETFDILWNIEHDNDNDNDKTTSTNTSTSKSSSKMNNENNNENTSPSKESAIISILRKRLGDACNEIGKILLSLVKEILQQSNNNDNKNNNYNNNNLDNNNNTKSSSIIFLLSAQFWFEEGLHNFEICNDVRNIALLRCNLCQCCKIRANSFLVDITKSDAERFLQDAANHLQLAHIALDTRDKVDTKTWDMVSEELAATFLILGVRRRQMVLGGGASTPNIMDVFLQQNEALSASNRLTPGNERSIIEPMSKALSIYTTLGNTHQVAAAHYQLALFYSKIWTCQRDEKITRVKLSLALKHFQSAHGYFIRNCIGNDGALTFVILCLDLSNLYIATYVLK